jgi:hypothetical protein
MRETFAAIVSSYFVAGIVLQDDRVVEAAPIIQYMKKDGWTRKQVCEHVKKKRWSVKVLYEREEHAPGNGGGEAGQGQANEVQP